MAVRPAISSLVLFRGSGRVAVHRADENHSGFPARERTRPPRARTPMAAATASSLALTLRSARCALARRRAPIRAPARRASSVVAGTGNPAGASDDAFVVTYCHVRAPSRPDPRAIRSCRPAPCRAPSARWRRPERRASRDDPRTPRVARARPGAGTAPAPSRVRLVARVPSLPQPTRAPFPHPPRHRRAAELRRRRAGVQRGEGGHPERLRGRRGGPQPDRLLPHHRHRHASLGDHLDRATAGLVREERTPGAARDHRRAGGAQVTTTRQKTRRKTKTKTRARWVTTTPASVDRGVVRAASSAAKDVHRTRDAAARNPAVDSGWANVRPKARGRGPRARDPFVAARDERLSRGQRHLVSYSMNRQT